MGIDLGKTVLVAVALDGHGELVVPAKRYTRPKLVAWLATLPPCLIGMEASCGAHHLARTLQGQATPCGSSRAQAVKPFRGAMKNNAADALAIAEAVRPPGLRAVPVESEAQLDVQAIHRVRTQLVRQRAATINQIRGLVRERGITVPQGPHRLAQGAGRAAGRTRRRQRHPSRAAAARPGGLAPARRRDLGARPPARGPSPRRCPLPSADDHPRPRADHHHGAGRRPRWRLGLGRARDLAAWLWLVPRQHSTGGRARLGGITKGGNRYVRTLLVHGARALRRSRQACSGRLGAWLAALESRAHRNKVTIALANKLARIAWALLTRKESYRTIAA